MSERMIEECAKEIAEAGYNPATARAIAAVAITRLDALGYAVVPKEPTLGMVEAGTEARWRSPIRDADNVREIFRAMIDAALEGK